MKIAILTHTIDAGESFLTVTRGLCHALAANGIEDIDMLSIVGKPDESVEPFPPQVRHVRLPGGRAARSVLPLRRYLSTAQPDVLISAPIWINLAALLAALGSRWRGKLIITHHHPIGLAHADDCRNNKYLARLLYRFAQGSIAVSPGVRDEAIRMAHLRPATVGCIPNALPPTPVPPDGACLHPWPRDPCRDGLVFVTVSRLVRVKSIPLLLQALRIANETIDARLIIVGHGPEEEAIRTLVRDMGLAQRVHLTGFVPSPAAYLAQSDVFVLASSEEGFGQSLVEAMARGLPVISTDAAGGGPRFVLGSGRYGILTPNGHAADLAGAMISIADPAARARYAARARRRVTDFSPAIVGARLLRFIERVPSRGAPIKQRTLQRRKRENLQTPHHAAIRSRVSPRNST